MLIRSSLFPSLDELLDFAQLPHHPASAEIDPQRERSVIFQTLRVRATVRNPVGLEFLERDSRFFTVAMIHSPGGAVVMTPLELLASKNRGRELRSSFSENSA